MLTRERLDLGGTDDGILLFSPDSRLLLDAGRFQLHLWDTATRSLVSAVPKAGAEHENIRCVVFSPDGRLIATAVGTAARVWRVPPLV